MKDKPVASKVDLNNAAVKQNHRRAAGLPVTGKTLPSKPKALSEKKCCA